MSIYIKDGNRFLEQIKFFGTNKILCKNCVIQKKINDGRTTWIVQRNKKQCYLKTNKNHNRNNLKLFEQTGKNPRFFIERFFNTNF